MTSINRGALACVLTLLVSLAAYVAPARAGDPATDPVLALALTPAPLASDALAPPLAEPVLLCGNRWVTGTYVLPQNCARACARKHSPAQCAQLVPLCRRCWSLLLACANNRTIPPGQRCSVCSARYAACIKPFL